ncbi:hypothetical protein ACIP6P_19590 [Streptomyces sp. NPDC088729]|uniref:DUF7144 family membrane protein n=1 Tax=Streptomyces sp. NPDC088729 TaxID=3365876 RepID=UPI0037FD9394
MAEQPQPDGRPVGRSDRGSVGRSDREPGGRPDGTPPAATDRTPPPTADAPPAASAGQAPRTGPGQADTPWQRTDGLSGPAPAPDPDSTWVAGGVLFAGVVMLGLGVIVALEGIAALVGGDVYGAVGGYLYRISLTGWGWIHLVLGVCVAVTGAGLLRRAGWARIAGIVLACLNLLAHFLFLPYAPLWSVVVIGLDIYVIWALCAYRRTTAPS